MVEVMDLCTVQNLESAMSREAGYFLTSVAYEVLVSGMLGVRQRQVVCYYPWERSNSHHALESV
jgi:hypothetical protein